MLNNFALLDFGAPELLVILAILLLLFGSKKLPEMSKGLGESIKELRKAAASTTELKDEVKSQVSQTEAAILNDQPQPERHEA